jgi:hypothetical protein
MILMDLVQQWPRQIGIGHLERIDDTENETAAIGQRKLFPMLADVAEAVKVLRFHQLGPITADAFEVLLGVRVELPVDFLVVEPARQVFERRNDTRHGIPLGARSDTTRCEPGCSSRPEFCPRAPIETDGESL